MMVCRGPPAPFTAPPPHPRLPRPVLYCTTVQLYSAVHAPAPWTGPMWLQPVCGPPSVITDPQTFDPEICPLLKSPSYRISSPTTRRHFKIFQNFTSKKPSASSRWLDQGYARVCLRPKGVLHFTSEEAFIQVCARCSHGKSETSEPKLAGLI